MLGLKLNHVSKRGPRRPKLDKITSWCVGIAQCLLDVSFRNVNLMYPRDWHILYTNYMDYKTGLKYSNLSACVLGKQTRYRFFVQWQVILWNFTIYDIIFLFGENITSILCNKSLRSANICVLTPLLWAMAWCLNGVKPLALMIWNVMTFKWHRCNAKLIYHQSDTIEWTPRKIYIETLWSDCQFNPKMSEGVRRFDNY